MTANNVNVTVAATIYLKMIKMVNFVMYSLPQEYIYVYSSDPELTYSVLLDARSALKAEGWICQGKGFDVQSDEETHTGRGLNVIYMEF